MFEKREVSGRVDDSHNYQPQCFIFFRADLALAFIAVEVVCVAAVNSGYCGQQTADMFKCRFCSLMKGDYPELK